MKAFSRFLIKLGKEIRNLISFSNYEKLVIFFILGLFVLICSLYEIPHSVTRCNIDLAEKMGFGTLGCVNPIAQSLVTITFALFSYQTGLKHPLKRSFIQLLLLSICFFGFAYMFLRLDIPLNIIATFFFMILYWVVGIICKHFDEGSEVYGLKQAVSQYVSPQIMRRVMTNPKSLRLGGETRNMTVLFSDIRNFTSISEKVPAKKLITFVNDYFTHVTKTILKNEGTIDKFAGDSLMAFWNAPLKEPEHAFRACETALKIREGLHEFNAITQTNGNGPLIKTGIGINTGKIIVGNVGSQNRFDYTVIGDDVNVAARLEGLTKMYKVPIILGHHTVLELKRTGCFSQFSIRLLDIVKTKGKKRTVGVYELMGPRSRKLETLIDEYEDAFSLYRTAKFEPASHAFIEILSKTNDYPSKMMLVRCYQFQEDPPRQDWDGSWEWGRK